MFDNLCSRWREYPLNGNTVHEQLRCRSSSVSVPSTPLTPALPEPRVPSIPVVEAESSSETSHSTPLSVKIPDVSGQAFIYTEGTR